MMKYASFRTPGGMKANTQMASAAHTAEMKYDAKKRFSSSFQNARISHTYVTRIR